MIKQLFLIGVILLLYSPAFSQIVSPLTGRVSADDSIILYRLALSASLDKMEKSWGAEYRDANVQSESELTDDSATQLGEHRVEYLGYQDMIAKYKKLRKEFRILRVHPMKIEDGKLAISITQHSFSYKKGAVSFGLSDWSTVTFRFDCEKKTFVIDDVELGGI